MFTSWRSTVCEVKRVQREKNRSAGCRTYFYSALQLCLDQKKIYAGKKTLRSNWYLQVWVCVHRHLTPCASRTEMILSPENCQFYPSPLWHQIITCCHRGEDIDAIWYLKQYIQSPQDIINRVPADIKINTSTRNTRVQVQTWSQRTHNRAQRAGYVLWSSISMPSQPKATV